MTVFEETVFAAHTNFEQISLPRIGVPWARTDRPREATCGLYQDATRLLFK